MVKGREPWFAAAHGVTKSQIQQSNYATTTVHKKEKEKKGKKKNQVWIWSNIQIYLPIYREANGNPLQYSCLKNSVDGGAW